MMCLLLALLLTNAPPPDSLEQIKKEPDLVRRSERALAWADSSVAAARKIVRDSGSRAQLFEVLEETVQAAELSLRSLRETGRKASKLSKQFKRGELQSREMVRQITDIAAALGIEDRPEAEKLRDRVSIVHEEFLLGVMSGK
jgi:hypothetical protein